MDARPALALLALVFLASPALALGQLDVQAPGLSAAADDLALHVEAPAVPSAPALAAPALETRGATELLSIDALAPTSIQAAHLGVLPVLAADGDASSAGSSSKSAKPLERSSAPPTAEVAAVGALAAAGTLALKLEAVRHGLTLLALPLYSRLRRSELLDNAVRERIYRAIEAQPGLSIIQVCRAGRAGWGTAVYHLQRLERDQLIVSRRDGQYRRFFLNGHAPDPGAVAHDARALQHALARDIAAFVLANPGSVQKEVCAALGISPPLASKWLGRLQDAGLLTSQREWKHVRYAPTPLLEARLGQPAALPAGAAAVPA